MQQFLLLVFVNETPNLLDDTVVTYKGETDCSNYTSHHKRNFRVGTACVNNYNYNM